MTFIEWQSGLDAELKAALEPFTGTKSTPEQRAEIKAAIAPICEKWESILVRLLNERDMDDRI